MVKRGAPASWPPRTRVNGTIPHVRESENPMSKASTPRKPKQPEPGRPRFTDDANHDSYGRHLVLDHVVSAASADQRERFEAIARSVRDLLARRWLLTQETQDKEN